MCGGGGGGGGKRLQFSKATSNRLLSGIFRGSSIKAIQKALTTLFPPDDTDNQIFRIWLMDYCVRPAVNTLDRGARNCSFVLSF